MFSVSSSLNTLVYYLKTYSWVFHLHRFLSLPKHSIDRPIFLLGTQGGGLTLLSRMLRRNPDVISVTGNSSYWSGADELANVYGFLLPKAFCGLRFKCPPHPLLTGPRSWSYACNELIGAYRQKAFNATDELKTALTNVIRLSAKRFANNESCYRFLDKSQTATVRVGLYYELLREFDPRFVLMAREPYVSVYRAAMGKAGDMQRFMENSILSEEERVRICAEHLGNSFRAVFEDSNELGIAVLLIKFEDLIEMPETTLRGVCDYLELDYNSDMLPQGHHRLPIGTRFSDRWYPLRTSVNEQYERVLPDYLINCLNESCADVIPRMGYQLR